MKVLTAPEVSGPIGATIDVDQSRRDYGVVVVSVAGEIDLFSVPRLGAALAEHLGRCNIVIDLHGVEFCDSSALRLFVDAQRRSTAAGLTLTLAHPGAGVRELFDVSGLAGVLHVTI